VEITIYAVFLILIVALVIVRKREVKRINERNYLQAYFDIFKHPVIERSDRITAWERKSYNQAYPETYVSTPYSSSSEKIVSIHKAI